MSRINDVGGMEGFGAIPISGDEPPFTADWEARVFALASVLLRDGHFELDEFRDAIERMEPSAYLAASYFERWFHAIEVLVGEKGLLARAGEEGRA